MGKLADWGAAARTPKPPMRRGNSPWAEAYADEIEWLWKAHAARNPRSLQVHLGPSELGVTCHRQVAGKMAGVPASNHVSDPWPSTRGTALHAHAVGVFEWSNETQGLRWLTEYRVRPHDLHPGTADLYDGATFSCCDHKFLGETSMNKVMSPEGPPLHYVVQLLLYSLGFRKLGLRVDRAVLLAYPATASSMSGLYVWEREHTPADGELLEQVWEWTEYRRQWAVALLTGEAELMDVPADTADDDQCYWCPFFRPAMAHGSVEGIGCPGGVKGKAERKALIR